MESLSNLERAVLLAIANQYPVHGTALRLQVRSASVALRENTGVGFFTTLSDVGGPRIEGAPSPLGDIGADVDGVAHGMGFLLWLQDGFAETLEGYTYDGDTAELDLSSLRWSNLGPRAG